MTLLEFNRGRPPTRLGGDGILPYFVVERLAVPTVLAVLREFGVRFSVQEGVRRMPSMTPEAGCIDRVSVHGGDLNELESAVFRALRQKPTPDPLSRLHRACHRGNASLLEQALRDGEDPNAAELMRGFTPVHYLMESVGLGGPRLAMLEQLIRAGADVRVRTLLGDTALDIAVREGVDAAILARLRQLGAP